VAAGADGCLGKDADAEDICEAIRTAARGQTFPAREIQAGSAPGAGDFVHLPPEYLQPDPVLASLVSPTLATSRMSTTQGP
jgi:DNA-binding NarL/FixJ family response regulator